MTNDYMCQTVESLRAKIISAVYKLPITEPQAMPSLGGVYFLLREGEIVYVGKSVNLHTRWKHHPMRRDVIYGNLQLRWKECSEIFQSCEHEEAFLITALCPQYNRMAKVKL